jgi:3,4-dihydroxy-2-butanone 4-phosphate synthase
MRLAELHPSGVICEILNDNGTMARVPDLGQFCEVREPKMVTIEDHPVPISMRFGRIGLLCQQRNWRSTGSGYRPYDGVYRTSGWIFVI